MTRADALTQTESMEGGGDTWMPVRRLASRPKTAATTFADRILEMLAAVKVESEIAIARAREKRDASSGKKTVVVAGREEKEKAPDVARGELAGGKNRFTIVDKPSPFLLYACMLPVFVLNRLLVLVNAYNVNKNVLFHKHKMRTFLPRALHFLADDVRFLAVRLLQQFDCQGRKCFRYAGVTHPMFAHMHSSVVLPALYAATHGDAEVSDAVFTNVNDDALALLRTRYRRARIVLRKDDLYYAYPDPLPSPPPAAASSSDGGERANGEAMRRHVHPLGGVNGAAYALLHDAATNMEHASAWFRTVVWYVEKEIPPSREVWDRYSNFNKFCFEHSDGECMRAIRETPELATVVVPDARLRGDVDGGTFSSVAGRFVTNIVRLYVIKLNAMGTRHTFYAQEDDYPELVMRANEPVRLLLSPPPDEDDEADDKQTAVRSSEAGGGIRYSENYPRPRRRGGGGAKKKHAKRTRGGSNRKATQAPYPPVGIYLTALSASLYDLVMYEYAMIRNEVRKNARANDRSAAEESSDGEGQISAAARTPPLLPAPSEDGDDEDATKVTLAKEHVVRAFFPLYERAKKKTNLFKDPGQATTSDTKQGVVESEGECDNGEEDDDERIVVYARDVRTFVNAFAHAMTIWAGQTSTGNEMSDTKTRND